jgi:hypothetical protein
MLPEESGGRFMRVSNRVERYAGMAGEEALAMAGINGALPGPLLLGMPPLETELFDRIALLNRTGATDYAGIVAAAADPAAQRRQPAHHRAGAAERALRRARRAAAAHHRLRHRRHRAAHGRRGDPRRRGRGGALPRPPRPACRWRR